MSPEGRWHTAAELAGLPGLPGTKRGVNLLAARRDWPWRPRRGNGGGREYPDSALPPEARAALERREAAAAAAHESRKAKLRAELDARAAHARRLEGLVRLNGLPDPMQRRADARLEILAALERFRDARGLPLVRARHVFAHAYNHRRPDLPDAVYDLIATVSAPTLARWQAAAAQDGLAALAGRYGNRRGTGLIARDPEVAGLIQAMLVDFPHIGAKQVAQAVRARFAGTGRRIPSDRSIQRHIAAWKADNAQVHAFVANPDAWRSKYLAAAGRADAGVTRLNQLWEADSTPADVMLADGRHAVIGVVDVWSRRARLLVAPTSRAAAIAALMRRCMLAWGVPEQIKTDQGRDYVSEHLRRVLAGLGVRHSLAPKFSPERKPHIESFFRTFSHGLVELLPGFIGHDVAGRKAVEARRSFAERFGRGGEPAPVAMTAAEFQDFCDRWCADVYEHEPHRGLGGSTPFQRAAEWREPVRAIDDERALDVLLAGAPGGGWRVVGKKGLRIDGDDYLHPELGAWVGRRVQVRFDPADLGRVYCFAEDGAFVCVAEASGRLGLDRREVAAKAREIQKARVRETRVELKRRARSARTADVVAEILAERRAAAASLVAFPAPAEPHDTPGLAAARDAAAAGPKVVAELTDEQKAAADAEWRRLTGTDAPAHSGNPPGFAGGQAPDGPPSGAPSGAQEGRPRFRDDVDFARWVLAHPDEADDDDRAWCEELMRSKSFRLLLGLEEERRTG